MASGFLMRVLVVHLLNDLSSSSALPTAWQDAEKKEVTGYGIRRPLHYVRALRQSNGNLQPEDGIKGQETRGFGDRRQESSREPQELSPSKSTFQTTLPATPRGFAINLEFPGLELLRKNLTDRLTNKDNYGHNSAGRKPSKESRFNFQGSDILHTLQTVAKPNVNLVLPLPTSPKIPIKLPLHSKETGSVVPIFDFDGFLGKTVEQMGLDLPFFGPDTQRQVEQAYETIHAHLDKLVSSHQPNPQTLTRHERPTGKRWGSRKKDVPKHKPSSQPKYPDRAWIDGGHANPPRKEHERAQPSSYNRFPHFNSHVRDSPWLSTGSPLSSPNNKKNYNHRLEPSVDRSRNTDGSHAYPLHLYHPTSLRNPIWNDATSRKKADTVQDGWRPPSMPNYYNSWVSDVNAWNPLQNPRATLEPEHQNGSPGLATDGHKPPADTLQSLDPWSWPHSAPHLNKEPQSHLHIPCMQGADCSAKPEHQWQIYYSPYNQHRYTSSPFQNVFWYGQYHGENRPLQWFGK